MSVEQKNKQRAYSIIQVPVLARDFLFLPSLVTKKRYTLGKEERLKSRKQIDLLFKKGASFNAGVLKVFHQLHEQDREEPLQFGVGAGTRYFKKAVHRNHIKRLIREAWRLQKETLKEQLLSNGKCVDVFFIFTGRELPDHELIAEKTKMALYKLQQLYT
jgi:ribonuclease P protein component